MAAKRGKGAAARGARIVAALEAAKGIVVLLAGFGILSLIHKNLHLVAVELVKVLHLNPAQHYPSIFIDLANRANDLQLWVLALSALLYSGARLVEAYGLWTGQQWAQWFGFLSGAIYIPVEAFDVSRELTWPRITVLAVNLGVVAYLARALARSGRQRKRRN